MKIGPALRLDRLPRCKERSFSVLKWEQKFWRVPLLGGQQPALYRAYIDTTFALYPPNHSSHLRARNWGRSRTPMHLLEAVRVGPPYAVEHVPWVQKNDTEAAFYQLTKRKEVGYWSEPLQSG